MWQSRGSPPYCGALFSGDVDNLTSLKRLLSGLGEVAGLEHLLSYFVDKNSSLAMASTLVVPEVPLVAWTVAVRADVAVRILLASESLATSTRLPAASSWVSEPMLQALRMVESRGGFGKALLGPGGTHSESTGRPPC